MGRERDAIDRVLGEYARLQQTVILARHIADQVGTRVDAGLRAEVARYQAEETKRTKRADSTFQSTVAQARRAYDVRLEVEVRDPIRQAVRYLGILAAPWTDPAWNQHVPGQQLAGQSAPALPGAIRIGSLVWAAAAAGDEAPAMLPLIGARSVLFMDGASKPGATADAIQSALFRIVATFPPGTYRLTLVDAVGLGQQQKVFLRLPVSVRRSKVYSEAREIEEELRRLVRYVETITQTRLRTASTIEEYHRRIGSTPVPYQFLAITGFPAGFTETSAAMLASIARNGPRTGTFALIGVDPNRTLPHGFDVASLAASCTVVNLAQQGSGATWNDPPFAAYPLVIDAPPPAVLGDRLLELASTSAEQQVGANVPFAALAVPEAQRWSGDSANGLSVPIGIDDTGAVHEFKLGSGLIHHGLIGGLPRSGKTNLLHVILVQLTAAYSPDELELYLVDFKEGVEFQDYATLELPHAQAVTLETEPEFGLSVLSAIQREMEDRGRRFRDSGSATLQEHRQHTGERLRRIVLVMDEYQILFGEGEDAALTALATTTLVDLVRRGPGFGIHVLLSSQTPASSFTSNRSAMNLLALRICLRCADADARLILGEGNDGARLLERPGEAIYNDAGGTPARNVFVQVARLEPDDRRDRLRSLSEEARRRGALRTEPTTVFKSRAPARLQDNRVLRQVLADPNEGTRSDSIRLWLGEPIDIRPHTVATIERQSRANLLVVGQDEAAGYALLASSLVSACAQVPPDEVDLVVLDLGRTGQRWSTTFMEVAAALPHALELVGSSNAEDAVQRAAAGVDARRSGGMPALESLLIVAGLDRFDALRDVDKYGNPGTCASDLLKILADGPSVGVHVLAWTSTLSGVEKVLRRSGLQAFGLRVALPLPVADANLFLDGPEASRLAPNRALFRDDSSGGRRAEKFKPYDLPSPDELASISVALRARVNRTLTTGGDLTSTEQEA